MKGVIVTVVIEHFFVINFGENKIGDEKQGEYHCCNTQFVEEV